MKRLNSKLISLSLVISLMISVFSILVASIPVAKAWDSSVYIVNQDINSCQTFSRVWDYQWDGCFGIPEKTQEYFDKGYINGQISLQTGFGGHVDLRLYRSIVVYDESGNIVRDCVKGWCGIPSIWLNTKKLGVTWSTGHSTFSYSFEDDYLIGDNQGLNYFLPTAPQQFQHYKWELSYTVVGYSYDIRGNSLDASANQYGNMSHDERSSTGNLLNWELCTGDNHRYGSSVVWAETYPNQFYSTVVNSDGLLGSSSDGSYCELSSAGFAGAMGSVCIQLSDLCNGPISIHASTPDWAQCTLLAYVSSDGNNWQCIHATPIPAGTGPQWMFLGSTEDGCSNSYQYVCLIAYSPSGAASVIYIDTVETAHENGFC